MSRLSKLGTDIA